MAGNRSLKFRKNPLSDPGKQLEFLSGGIFTDGGLTRFEEKLIESGVESLRPGKLQILQLNLGYMCNQTCSHCHVDAGPDRKEIMTQDTMRDCLKVIKNTEAHTLDLTGGAPEMNPHFRWFVEEATCLGVKDIIVRSNLTILRANKKYHDLPAFFRKHGIHIISSLPFYRREKTDRQRGKGVFDQSIEALKRLNAEGYGMGGTELKLDLVYNPSGAFLPTSQEALERDFKKALLEDFGIRFNRLFSITNLPISRFLEYLLASENYEDYMQALIDAYNPTALNQLMCLNTLSVGWDGRLYDCDFNQMLQLEVDSTVRHIRDFNSALLRDRKILTSQHCYGCTAGAGSSCQGALI